MKKAAFVLALVMLLGCVSGCGAAEGEASVQSVSMICGLGSVGLADRFAGIVSPLGETTIKKNDAMTIDTIKVKVGDSVKKGDVLLELDESDTQEAYDRLAEQIEYTQTVNDYDNRMAQIDIDLLNRYPREKVVLITTGSQGEPMSALTRMAYSDHRQVEVGPDDYIIISATPIPGNEKTVGRVINELMKRGCDVVYEKMYDVHVSGHACQEELKIIHGLTRPRYFIPVHGEQKHLHKHANLAKSMGMPPQNVLITDIGKVVEITPDKMEVTGAVPAGRVMVDGLGVGDVGNVVLRDRHHLSEDGIIIVTAAIDGSNGQVLSGPDLVSRGFVYVRESEELMEGARTQVEMALDRSLADNLHDWASVKARVREALSSYIYRRTKRSPMILPILLEV